MLKVTDPATMNSYVDGVIMRAKCHAENVQFVVPSLRGHVERVASQIDLYGDGTKNVSWFVSRRTNRRYAFRYEHSNQTVELRRDTVRGAFVARFQNATSQEELYKTFDAI